MKRSLLYLLTLLLILTSCQDKLVESYEYEAIKVEFEVGATSLAFNADQQSKGVQIKCNGYWTASVSSSASSWLYLNANEGKGNGMLTIHANANTSATSSRSGVVSVSNSIKTATIDVTQEPSDELLSASNTSLDYLYDGGTYYVTINSNVDWTASSNSNWLTLSQSSSQLTVRVDANYSYSPRTAAITIKGTALTISISVNQSGVSAPMVNVVHVSSITQTSAVCTFTYSSSDIRIGRYGVCYSATEKEPTTNNETKSVSTSSYNGNASFSLSGLTQNRTYYVRPYVTTSIGTTYGSVVSFTTAKSNSPEEGDNPTPNY